MTTIRLPASGGRIEDYTLGQPGAFHGQARGSFDRIAFAAAHVVSDPLAHGNPTLDTCIDWDATIRYRQYLWSLGFHVAEAMDTAQRGAGLDWTNALRLIAATLDAAHGTPGARVACGVGTDQLAPAETRSLDDVIAAYEEQCAAVERLGGRLIVMASRALARIARAPEDYARVYGRILTQCRKPVILHWLGEAFDPQLAGYWGARDVSSAMDVCLALIDEHASKVDGIKISLLDKDLEIRMRRCLPRGVRMYTGDDFNYPELIAGDDRGHSDALLGIFDGIAPAASVALSALGAGNQQRFLEILEPTLPLARHLFAAPTRFYKTGIVLLAHLCGHQAHFTMVGGQQACRSTLHLAELFRLADRAGIFPDPGLAAARMRAVMQTHGVQ